MNLRYFEKCYLNHPVILQDYSVIIVTVIFAISQYAKWLDVYCSSHFIKCDLCGLETANYATIHGWKYRHPSMYSRSTYTLNNTETTNPRMHSVQWLTLKLCSFYCLSTTVCLFFPYLWWKYSQFKSVLKIRVQKWHTQVCAAILPALQTPLHWMNIHCILKISIAAQLHVPLERSSEALIVG